MYRIDERDGAIVIEGFDQGIADDPFDGISDMRNVNITSVPGEASVNFKTAQISTPDVGNFHISRVTTGAAGFVVLSTAVTATFFSGSFGGTTPTGITAGQEYILGTNGTTTGYFVYRNYSQYSNGTGVNISGSVTGASLTSHEVSNPRYGCYDKTTDSYFIIDSAGRPWMIVGSGSSSVFPLAYTDPGNTSGNGIVAYEGYLLVFGNSTIDYMNLTTFVWTYGWDPSSGASGASNILNTGTSTNNPHQPLIGVNDNIVYYPDANFLGSLFIKDSATAFDPTDVTTYTWAQQALTIPSNDIANCLAELGTNLLVGGQRNAIYPWNRVAQVSGKSINNGYSYPILLAENWIANMVTVNTNTYIFAGQRGRIYVTNGSQANLFKKVPDHISGTVEPYFQWGGAAFQKNQLYFGVYGKTNADATLPNSSTQGYGGLWAIDLDSKALRLTNQMSLGSYEALVNVILAQVPTANNAAVPGSGLYLGWDAIVGSADAIDATQTTPYTGGQTTVDSDLIPVGTFTRPRNNSRIEFKLTKPLVNGESITLRQRLDFSQSYTDVLNWTTTGVFSGDGPINWANAQWLQVQAALTTTGTSPSYTRLREIRITETSNG